MRIEMKQFRDSVAPRRAARKLRSVPAQQAGLTLVEMMVVLVIIALVAALIVPNVIGRPDQARVTTATTNLGTITSALTMYRLDNGDYPTTDQGLQALVSRPSTPPVPANWAQGGYLSGLETDDQGRPVDPWGNPYVYRNQSGAIELTSLGRDGKPGGEGLDADISTRK